MAFNPRTFFPIFKGADSDDNVLAQPIIVVRTYQVSPNWDQSQDPAIAADQVEQYYTPTIKNFVDRSRDYHQRSGLDSTRTNLIMDGMQLRYERVFGVERLFINAVPESFGGGQNLTDLNYDGYILILAVLNANEQSAKTGNFSFDCQLNNRSIGKFEFSTIPFDMNVSEPQVAATIFTFGKTALKCWSLADLENPVPIKGQHNQNNPNKHVNNIIPPLPDIKEFTNTGAKYFDNLYLQASPKVKAHPDLPMYAVYDWVDLLNQRNVPAPHNFPVVTPIKPTIIPVTDTSILKNTDINKFRALLTSVAHVGQTCQIIMQAEFYSRYYKRHVFTSWLRRVQSPQSITVNDTPLYFSVWSFLAPELPMDIDLTSQKLDRTTPTPYHAFLQAPGDDDISTVLAQYGKPPYCSGYWRIGDQPSQYPQLLRDPWAVIAPTIGQYYDDLVFLDDFLNNKYNPDDSITVDTIEGGTVTYTTTSDFWVNTTAPEYLQLKTLVADQYTTWKSNNKIAQDSLNNADSFFGDPEVLTQQNALLDDATALNKMLFGVLKDPVWGNISNPYGDYSAFWHTYYSEPPPIQLFDYTTLMNHSFALIISSLPGIFIQFTQSLLSPRNITELINQVETMQTYKIYDPNDTKSGS
jgi:hypothetical protein